MKKKSTMLSVLALLLALLLTVCNSQPTASSASPESSSTESKEKESSVSVETPAEVMPMRYYMPGAPTTQEKEATAAINEKLAADGVPIDFTPMYVPWDQWTNKINLMLSAGDEFELLHVMDDYIPIYAYVSRDGLTPLDELIEEYAPALKDRFEDILWKCATVEGKIYAIPDYWRDNSGDGEGQLNFRLDKLEEFGLSVPTTLDEVLETLPVLQQKWEEQDGEKRYVYEHSVNRCPLALHRTYDTWPYFTSQDGLFCVRQDGTAQLYFTTEEFKKDCEFMHTLYTQGLIHPDVLNLPADTRRTALDYGDYLMGIMTGPTESTLLANGIEGTRVSSKALEPEKPYLRNLPLLNANAVPATCKNPQAGLLFLDWMYSSQENQDLVLYGIPGTHWNPVGDDQYELIKGEDNKPLYQFDSWMIEYVPYHRFSVDDVSTEEERADYVSNIYPDNTVDSVMVGFGFNSEPVKVEYANLQAEYTTAILPIKVGVVSYEEGFESAMEKMRTAGCEAVIAEYQKQLTDYIESQK